MCIQSASGDSRSEPKADVVDFDSCSVVSCDVTPCVEKLECASENEGDLNPALQYVSIFKVSRYTGEESVMEAHENDLTCTQAFFQPLNASRAPSDKEIKVEVLDSFSSSPDLFAECSPKAKKRTKVKSRRRGFTASSGKTRHTSSQGSPSTHPMSTRNSAQRESPSPVQSPLSSQPTAATGKNVGQHIRVLLLDEPDVDGSSQAETFSSTPDRNFLNSNSETSVSRNEDLDVGSSIGVRDYNKNVYSKNKPKDSRKNLSRAKLETLKYGTAGKKNTSSALDSGRGKSPRKGVAKKVEKQGDASSSDKVNGSNVSSRNRVSRKEGQVLLKKELNSKYVTKAENKVEELSYYSRSLETADTAGLSDERSESSLGVNKYSGEASTIKSKPSEWSDDEDVDDFTPGKRKKTNHSDKEKESKQQVRRRNRGGKVKRVGSDNAESKRAKIKSATTGGNTRKRKKKTDYVGESSERSSESETQTAAEDSSETKCRSERLRSFSNEALEKCTRQTTPGVENCKSVCKQTNAQKFSMEDLSLDDLEVMFEANISYLREINRGIRPSERHDRFQNGNLNQEHLVYLLSTTPYSDNQVRHLSHLCREKFCHSLEDRIGLFRYISRVLVPDLCTKLFMDRFDMNEEQALAMMDKAYIHVPHEDDA